MWWLRGSFAILKMLGSRVAYRIVHGFPAGMQNFAARMIGVDCPEASYHVRSLGIMLRNPIGLAAGLNKDGNLTFLGDALCFGFTVVGSVLPYRYGGASRKLLLRLSDESLVNRLGLPSRGADYVLRALKGYRASYTVPVVNIAGLRLEDYVRVADLLGGVSPWLEVNVSCPNTEEHGTFEDPVWAERILRSVRKVYKGPLFLKIPNLIDKDLIIEYIDAVKKSGANGIVAGNTSKIQIRGVQAGLSGSSIYWKTRIMVKTVSDHLGSDMVLVGVGGITREERAIELLEIGADLLEMLTVLLRLGPARTRRIIYTVSRWITRR